MDLREPEHFETLPERRAFTPRSLAAAGAVYALVVAGGALWHFGSASSDEKKDETRAIDMTVVVDENLDKPPDDLKPVENPKPPEPEPPKPEPPKPDPPKPAPPPPVALPAVVEVKDPPKEEKKEPEKAKPPPKKPEFKKGKKVTRAQERKRVERPVVRRNVDVRAALGGNGPRTERRLPDFQKYMNAGACVGTRNNLSVSEGDHCRKVIMRQFKEKWNPPAPDPSLKKPHVAFSLGFDGSISSPELKESSGSAEVDRSVLDALRRVGRFHGLSREFIEANRRIILELEILEAE